MRGDEHQCYERPARILFVGGGRDVTRHCGVLRAEGHIVELVEDGAAVIERLEREPPIDVIAIGGLADLARTHALAAARERNVWCLYLESRSATTPLRADERAEFVAALPAGADDAQIGRTLRAMIAARRSRDVDA